jgi:hypothetical protein
MLIRFVLPRVLEYGKHFRYKTLVGVTKCVVLRNINNEREGCMMIMTPLDP